MIFPQDLKKKDDEKAFGYYLISAEGGNVTAQSQVGYMYSCGIGTELDKKAAFEWNKKAALQDDVRGMISYGCDLIDGKIIEKDIDLGLFYLHRAAEIGNKKEKASTNENMEKLEPSYTDGENVKYYDCHRIQLGGSSCT